MPGSSIRGIFQARILEWVAISFSRVLSQPRDRTPVSRIAPRLYHLTHQGITIMYSQIPSEYKWVSYIKMGAYINISSLKAASYHTDNLGFGVGEGL